MPVAVAEILPCTLHTTFEHMEICLLAWFLKIDEEGGTVYAKCGCADS